MLVSYLSSTVIMLYLICQIRCPCTRRYIIFFLQTSLYWLSFLLRNISNIINHGHDDPSMFLSNLPFSVYIQVEDTWFLFIFKHLNLFTFLNVLLRYGFDYLFYYLQTFLNTLFVYKYERCLFCWFNNLVKLFSIMSCKGFGGKCI